MHVLVMAKEPIPGNVKTRLCPPCTLQEAADLAEAALVDVLAAATSSGADRVVLAIDGRPGRWCPPGVEIIHQVDGSFDRRLGAAWEAAGGPGIQIGMDTPQVSAADLNAAMAALADRGLDATIGPAEDGGWWLIGLRRPDAAVFADLPMSRPDTGARQLGRFDDLGLRYDIQPVRRDVDEFDDALAVAALVPTSHFARRLRQITSSPVPVGSAS